MALRHFLSVADVTSAELRTLVSAALRLKKLDRAQHAQLLPNKTMALVFEKPSLRTRVSFEAGMTQLGGHAIYLDQGNIGLGVREPIFDVARVLSTMTDVITARVFSDATVRELAEHATVPVINALSDREHPCQAIADLLTIMEQKGRLDSSLRVTFVGDGNNNVTHSLALALAKLGVHFTVASPAAHAMDPEISREVRAAAAENNSELVETDDVMAAVDGTDVVYTDTFVSMGQEDEKEARIAAFEGFRVGAEHMSRARADAIFMHDMPGTQEGRCLTEEQKRAREIECKEL